MVTEKLFRVNYEKLAKLCDTCALLGHGSVVIIYFMHNKTFQSGNWLVASREKKGK